VSGCQFDLVIIVGLNQCSYTVTGLVSPWTADHLRMGKPPQCRTRHTGLLSLSHPSEGTFVPKGRIPSAILTNFAWTTVLGLLRYAKFYHYRYTNVSLSPKNHKKLEFLVQIYP